MKIEITTSALIAFMALFFGVGIVMTVRTMLQARRDHAAGLVTGDLRQRLAQRVGPVTPEKAPLTPALRVLIEFVCALFGFPGLGWSLSTRLMPGLGLMLAGPIFCWMVWPVFLHYSGILAMNVQSLVWELPVVATASAGGLAVAEIRAARRRHADLAA